jgi:hypothetical protein
LICSPSGSPLEEMGFETSVRHWIAPSGGTRRFHGERKARRLKTVTNLARDREIECIALQPATDG